MTVSILILVVKIYVETIFQYIGPTCISTFYLQIYFKNFWFHYELFHLSIIFLVDSTHYKQTNKHRSEDVQN